MPDIPVIYFHSVAPIKNKSWVRNYLTLALTQFEAFLIYLKKNHWSTIFFDEYYHFRKKGVIPKKVCCLSFDDGFLDNYVFVFPLLKKYGFKATYFINPEFVDKKRDAAITLDNVWSNTATKDELPVWGYVNEDEIKLLHESGVIDIQAHTMTHTKYFVSDKLVSLHHPGDDCLYPIGNIFPQEKPYYINNPDFEKLIPYGYPFFEEKSSVTAKRVFINEDFNQAVIDILQKINWNAPDALFKGLEIVRPLHAKWSNENKIISNIETVKEYEIRVKQEITNSKRYLENLLNKEINILCWPHGDNSDQVHKWAIKAGFLLTTRGKNDSPKARKDPHRIQERMGINFNNAIKRIKTISKIKAANGTFPYNYVMNIYRKLS